MDINKGKRLREEWGDKPCNHPNFEKETQGAPMSNLGYVENKTGDYICTQCGEVFTKAEKLKLIGPKSSRKNKGIAIEVIPFIINYIKSFNAII